FAQATPRRGRGPRSQRGDADGGPRVPPDGSRDASRRGRVDDPAGTSRPDEDCHGFRSARRERARSPTTGRRVGGKPQGGRGAGAANGRAPSLRRPTHGGNSAPVGRGRREVGNSPRARGGGDRGRGD